MNKNNSNKSDSKKITFILGSMGKGGAERVVSILTSELSKLGANVHLLVFYRVENEYSVHGKVKIHTIKESRSEYDSLSMISKFRELRKKLK